MTHIADLYQRRAESQDAIADKLEAICAFHGDNVEELSTFDAVMAKLGEFRAESANILTFERPQR